MQAVAQFRNKIFPPVLVRLWILLNQHFIPVFALTSSVSCCPDLLLITVCLRRLPSLLLAFVSVSLSPRGLLQAGPALVAMLS